MLYHSKRKALFLRLKSLFIEVDTHTAALSVTLGVCLGIIPFYGFTFLLVAGACILLRMNHVIAQAVHIIMTPIQALLLLPYLLLGQYMYGLGAQSFLGKLSLCSFTDLLVLCQQSPGIIAKGLLAWLTTMTIAGPVTYLVFFLLFRRLGVKNCISPITCHQGHAPAHTECFE